jgi:hypothetical protein
VTMAELRSRSNLTQTRRIAAVIGVVAILALGLEGASTQWDLLALVAFVALTVAVVVGFVESWSKPPATEHRDATSSEPSNFVNGRRWLVAFMAVALGAIVAIQIWFAPGTAVAGGDVTFPNGLAWLGRVFSPWAFSGANLGGPNLLRSHLPWGLLAGVVQSVGGSAELAQRIWYTLLFTGAGVAAVALLRTLGMRPLAAACGAYVYLFNGYVLGWVGVNSTHLAALAILPGILACVLAASKGTVRVSIGVILLAASAPIVGVASDNPPLVLVILLPVLLCPLLAGWLWGRAAAKRGLRVLAVGLPILTLASLYWVVPEALAYSSLGNPNFTPTTSWGFTEIRATLGNALWLNNAWAWGHPEYVPYATDYLVQPLALAKYLLPALAFAPLTFLKRDPGWISGVRVDLLRVSVAFAAVALVFVFLSTGTLPPGSLVFNLLYSLPGGVLLREPGRFLMLAALAYSVLIAVTATSIAALLHVTLRRSFAKDWLGSVRAAVARILPYGRERARLNADRPVLRLFVPLLPLTGTILLLASLVPAYPLMTGAVVPGQRANLPSTQVSLPVYWQRMFDDVNRDPTTGALLVLPPDDYYAMPYRFLYYGPDTFIVQSVARHVILPNPQGYIQRSPQLLAATAAVATNLLNSDDAAAARIITAMQSSLILVRGDIDPNSFLLPNRHIISPQSLSRALRASQHFTLVHREGPLELYRITDPVPGELASTPSFATVNTPSPDLSILSLFPAGTDLVTEAPEPGVPGVFALPDLSLWDVSAGKLSSSLQVPAVGWTYHLDELGAKGPGLTLTSAAVTGANQALTVSAALTSQNLVPNGDFSQGLWQPRVGNCAAFNPGTTLISASVVDGPQSLMAMRLSAAIDSACESKVLNWTSGPFLLRLKFRHIVGASPRLCLFDVGTGQCVSAPAIPTGSGWQQYQAVIVPGPNATGLRLYLYSDDAQTCQGGSCTASLTTNDYADVEAFSLPAAPRGVIVATPQKTASAAQLVVLRDTYSSDWQGPSGSRHVVVDGLFNGWVGSTATTDVSYGPGPLLTAATVVSPVTLVAVGVLGVRPAIPPTRRAGKRLFALVKHLRRSKRSL